MRRFAPIALLALAIAGCGATEAAAPTTVASASPEPVPVTSTPAAADEPEPAPTETYTPREQAFMRAVGARIIRDDVIEYDSSVLSEGRRACGESESESAFEFDEPTPPTVDAIIENDLAGDKTLRYAVKYLCPKYLAGWRKAKDGFTDGIYEVGKDIKPGTYRTTPGRITDCYWERSTPHGDIIDNGFISNAPRGVIVTIRTGEGFKSEGCGNWMSA